MMSFPGPVRACLGGCLAVLMLGCGCRTQAPQALPSAEGLITPMRGPFDSGMKKRVIDEVSLVLKTQAYAGKVDFSDWDSRVANAWESIDAATTSEAFGKVINEILKGYGLSHLVLATEAQLAYLKPGNPGYGFRFLWMPQGWSVMQVKIGSPAEKAGLRGGDILKELNGSPFDDKRMAALTETAKPLVLAGIRKGSPFQMKIDCLPFDWDTPPMLQWLNPDLALLKVPSFRNSAYEDAKVDELFQAASRARAMVLDLRGNTGGNTDNFQDLASHFLPRGRVLAYQVTRDTEEAFRKRHGRSGELAELATYGESLGTRPVQNRFKGPVVVLVDRWSHSSAELCAAALQDWGRARVLGTPSGGQVLTTSSADLTVLSGGFRLQWPAGVPLSSKRQRLEGRGVKPDLGMDPVSTANDDVILAKARELLKAH